MRLPSTLGVVALLVFGTGGAASAHQPVMDMAPRWEGGFGFQVRHEYRFTNDRLSGDEKASNPLDRDKRVHTTWLEGVYTWKRELRATIKVPWVEQSRVSVLNGRRVREHGSGVGDIVVGLPLKKYWNARDSTYNLSFTPSLRAPTGSVRDDHPVGDGSWDLGLSTSFSSEHAKTYSLVDLFWWKNTRGTRGINQGDVVGLDMNLGYHPYHSNARNLGIFTMLDVEARYEGGGRDTRAVTGGTRLGVGPILVAYWKNVMARGELKVPVYEHVRGTQFARGIQFNLGIGVTF